MLSLSGRSILSRLFLLQDTRTTDFDWSWLFAPFPYGARYKCFLRILLSAPMAEELLDWVGWVKSRFRNLILKVVSPVLKHVWVFFFTFRSLRVNTNLEISELMFCSSRVLVFTVTQIHRSKLIIPVMSRMLYSSGVSCTEGIFKYVQVLSKKTS